MSKIWPSKMYVSSTSIRFIQLNNIQKLNSFVKQFEIVSFYSLQPFYLNIPITNVSLFILLIFSLCLLK